MTISAVHATDASSATPTPHATINSPRSRPPPANTNITRLASNFAITPQALAADLATRSVRDRPGKWCVVTVGLEPGVYKHVQVLRYSLPFTTLTLDNNIALKRLGKLMVFRVASNRRLTAYKPLTMRTIRLITQPVSIDVPRVMIPLT